MITLFVLLFMEVTSMIFMTLLLPILDIALTVALIKVVANWVSNIGNGKKDKTY